MMKNRPFRLLLFMSLALCFSLNAQVIDLTTGTGPIGTVDPLWQIQLPTTTNFIPITISTGDNEFGGGAVLTINPQDSCGQWISPYLTASFNFDGLQIDTGIFVYRRQFELGCLESNCAVLDIPFISADNQVLEVAVNGVPVTLPTPVPSHINPGSLSDPCVNVIANSVNTVDITVRNLSIWTALQVCGTLTAAPGMAPNCPPVDPSCCLTEAGQVLSWGALTGAVSYQLEINENDPECCESAGAMVTTLINLTGNSYVYTPTTDCFSWRIRAVYAGGQQTPFTESQCSCGPIIEFSCIPPDNLTCEDGGFNDFWLSWNSVPGALGYEIEIVWDDPSCCGFGQTIPTTTIITEQGTNISVPLAGTNGCFSWRVRTQCADGSFSAWSAPQCSCGSTPPPCDPPANLNCEEGGNDDLFLSWNAVAGAPAYEVEITWNDPSCCTSGLPTTTMLLQTTGTNVSIPMIGTSGCFSWRVRTQCVDGSFSAWSAPECSCGNFAPPCDTPTGLNCEIAQNALFLSWNGVAGAASYEIEVTYNDPQCCTPDPNSEILVTTVVFTSTATNVTVPIGWVNNCFSWRVRTLCTNGSTSAWSGFQCSCGVSSPGSLKQGSGASGTSNVIGSGVGDDLHVIAIPNPASNQVEFRLETKPERDETGTLTIVDLNDRVVHAAEVNLSGTMKVDVQYLPAGMYLYTITSGVRSLNGKFMVER